MWRSDASRRRCVATTPAKCVELGQHLRGCADEQLRPVRLQLTLQLADLTFFERLDDEQAVDKEPVALGRWHASRGSMRTGNEAHLLQIGHHVADRRRRKLEAGLP